MTAAPPPWRVFDSPPRDDAQPGDDPDDALGGDVAGRTQTAGRLQPGAGAGRVIPRPDVLAGLGAALGGLVVAWLLATGGPGGSISVGGGQDLIASDDPSGARGGALGGEVVVDVTGAVLQPGVYHLPGGSRIGDAISAAGGFGPRVAADEVDRSLNLAALVHDGDRIAVPSRDDVAAGPGGDQSPAAGGGGLIDLNSASESELDTLPGIGPVTAGKIIASRSDQAFRTVDELLERKLVGAKTFDSIKDLVTVGP